MAENLTVDEWQTAMAALVETANYFSGCDVLDLDFDSGHQLEVYVAASEQQHQAGLANVHQFDLDLGGMLFCFNPPTQIPFTAEKMIMDMDIAWYSEDGTVLDSYMAEAGDTNRLLCDKPFSYVLETPAGFLPTGNLVLSKADEALELAQLLVQAYTETDAGPITLPDGSFPISSLKSLKSAIHLVGRSKTYSEAQVKAHIIAAAKTLGLTGSLPPDWKK